MANVNAPRGFRPVRYADGKPYMGAMNRYYITGIVLGVGDPVVRLTASADPLGGPQVVRASTGSYITGVVVGFEPLRNSLTEVGYSLTGDSTYVYVADEPDLLFEVQEGGSSTALAVTDIGNCINSVTALNADTTIGSSKYQIDNGAKGSGDTWFLVELVQRADNALGKYAKWIVQPSLHTQVNAGAANILAI